MNKSNISFLLALVIGTTTITACNSNEETVTETMIDESESAKDLREETRINKYKSLAKITYEQAKKVGEAAIGGKANEVELDIENGGLVYDVEIGNKEAIIDAGNGKVLYIQDEEAEEKAKANKPRSSIRIPEVDSE
ncbi:MAG: PepSY domain-containing protein [Cyanobacteria bacterium P01_A01_bin.84]